MTDAPRTYADHVSDYALVGWPCIFPVPPLEKSPPPAGFTGAEGRDTDPIQLVEWAGSRPYDSIALRMPDGVIGIDVDHYDKVVTATDGSTKTVSKRGNDTLAELEQVWGELPPTWSSTSRGSEHGPGPSRILLYRAPAQRYVTKFPDVEIIQRHHRYAVVAPSVHETGGTYTWYDPAGLPSQKVPSPYDLTELPAAWAAALAEGASAASPASADSSEGWRLLEQLRDDWRPECAHITNSRMQAIIEVGRADAGSRHDTMTGRVHGLVQAAAQGHQGVAWSLTELRTTWDTLTDGEDRGEEFERMLLTSARKAVTLVGVHQVVRDPCLREDEFAVFASAPEDADGNPVEAIAPPRLFSVREVIGAHLFDPVAELDQPLAQAVLERTYPVMRYASDSGGWLLRLPDRWELHNDLRDWGVAQVASLMPTGDPDGDKAGEEKARSSRRARFNTQSGARAIAGKMGALVAAGLHPCAVQLSDLDSQPHVLWAGGYAWDLNNARPDAPMESWIANIDPSTPHMHTAGVTPERVPTPRWDAFLEAVWPDPEMRAWSLRVLSIALTGYADRALPILIGDTGRGKTQLISLLMSVLGSYAHAADPRLLGVEGAKAHQSIVFALKGRRLSFIDEGPREGRFAQERLKQLTGGGQLTANQMNQNPITFPPTHTLVLTTNDEPVLTDPAIRARARLIPCDGDPELVRTARAAIGHTSSTTWRTEAPGVLAMMMTEAAGWLSDPTTGLVTAAPERLRYLAETLGAEQDPIRVWVDEETEPSEAGTASRDLYQAFVASCRRSGMRADAIPSETKWGRALVRLGYPPIKTNKHNMRQLRVATGGFLPGMAPPPTPTVTVAGGGLTPQSGGLVEGSALNPPPMFPQVNPQIADVSGGYGGFEEGPTYMRAHTHAREGAIPETLEPSTENPPNTVSPAQTPGSNPPPGQSYDPRQATSPDNLDDRPSKRRNQDDEWREEHAHELAERAATKKAAADVRREAKRQAAIAEAGGPRVALPAVVTADGIVRPVALADAGALLGTITAAGAALTVDVEHTGYPVGHRDYALRTIQLGNTAFAVVLDATDPDHTTIAAAHLAAAVTLHAHSATADLIPLAHAGLLDLEDAWSRMHDTVVLAKLADPASTGSDPGLKKLAESMLGDRALSPSADEARKALFKAGKWLTEKKATTPIARSGWAQVDSRSEVMVRYAASDVLDDAVIAERLPVPSDALLERERAANRMTARVADRGLRLDPEHTATKHAEQTAVLADASARLRSFGIENPGSDAQVGAAIEHLGASLPRTKTGRPSVAKGTIDQYANADGALGELVRARLDYQTAENRLGLFLDQYTQLIERGDGRARPTIYTLAADTGRMSCVQSDALIEMPRDLTKYPAGVPITEVKAGDLVYGFDHHRELVLRRVKWCEQTGVRQTYTITAENRDGHRLTLRATEEHLIRLYDGDWRATEHLMHQPGRPHREDGPRLMTMVRRYVDGGYAKFFPHANAKGNGTNGGGKNREHRWVAAAVRGQAISTKWDVHHRDGNKLNNHPDNLEPMPREEHRGNRHLARGEDQGDWVNQIGSNDYRAVSVEPALIEPVWDMEVEDVHNFIANGINVHNCVRPNLQQVPREGGYRACITADPGHLLISADFSGVELRVAAALSQDRNLMAIVADPERDIHREIAQLVWGPDAGKAERYQAKRKVFGRLYGSGLNGLVTSDPPVSEGIARSIIDAMDQMTPGLTEWSRQVADAVETGRTQFPAYSGRTIYMPTGRPYAAPNYCIQGTARELLIDALMRWSTTRWGDAVLLPVHDELVVHVPEDDAEEATAALVECMTSELHGVQIIAEPSAPTFAWADSA